MCMIGSFVRGTPVDKKDAILAFRAFQILDDGTLKAVFKPRTYRHTGTHVVRTKTISVSGSSHGFWVFKDTRTLMQHIKESTFTSKAYAKVRIWGEVAVHTDGYRASHMDIVSLYVLPGSRDKITALKVKFNIPVHVLQKPVPSLLQQMNKLG